MNRLRFILCTACLLPAPLVCLAQQASPPLATGTPPPPATTSPAPTTAAPSSATPTSIPVSVDASPAPVSPALSPAASPALSPTGKPANVSPEYVIGPDDSLQITVWKEPTLSGNLPVRPDGMISIALIGDIAAAGRNPMQLGADIATRLKKYINDPTVNVTVLGVNSKRIFLLGEVQHIGAMPLTADITPLQAISAAGGLTPFANAKHIYILRTRQGKQQKIPFNYKKAVKDGDQQGVSLLPGDTIVVP